MTIMSRKIFFLLFTTTKLRHKQGRMTVTLIGSLVCIRLLTFSNRFNGMLMILMSRNNQLSLRSSKCFLLFVVYLHISTQCENVMIDAIASYSRLFVFFSNLKFFSALVHLHAQTVRHILIAVSFSFTIVSKAKPREFHEGNNRRKLKSIKCLCRVSDFYDRSCSVLKHISFAIIESSFLMNWNIQSHKKQKSFSHRFIRSFCVVRMGCRDLILCY